MVQSVVAMVSRWDAWVWFGFLAQALFAGRFVVQWWATERARRVVIPGAFWVLSIIGGSLILVYSIVRRVPVFILGSALALVIYLRNMWFHYWGATRGQSVQPSI